MLVFRGTVKIMVLKAGDGKDEAIQRRMEREKVKSCALWREARCTGDVVVVAMLPRR